MRSASQGQVSQKHWGTLLNQAVRVALGNWKRPSAPLSCLKKSLRTILIASDGLPAHGPPLNEGLPIWQPSNASLLIVSLFFLLFIDMSLCIYDL